MNRDATCIGAIDLYQNYHLNAHYTFNLQLS